MRDKLILETDKVKQIKSGLQEDLFEVFYQPIVDLMTNKPVGFEALIRLRNLDGEIIPASEYISLAEEKGLISDIMDFVCDTVKKDSAVLLKLCKHLRPYVNINIAASQMRDIPRALNALKRARAGGLTINAELTESTMFVDGSLKSQIQKLNNAGFKVAIDDFGTGYSSIQRLNEISVHTLKIDQTYVQKIEDHKDYTFLAAIFKLAQTRAENVIIEGIETLEQKLLIMQMGMRFAQGYFFCRPMDINSLEAFLLSSQEDKLPPISTPPNSTQINTKFSLTSNKRRRA